MSLIHEGYPTCSHCEERPASCLGCYEDHSREDCKDENCTQHDTSWACDECCGHGCEDGHCHPLSDLDGYVSQLGLNTEGLLTDRDSLRAEVERLTRERDEWKECANRIALQRQGEEMAAIHEANQARASLARITPVFEIARRWCNRPESVLHEGAGVLANDAEMWRKLRAAVNAATKETK